MITDPEYHQQEGFKTRLQKLEEIKALNLDPYPPHFCPTTTAGELAKSYEGQAIGNSEEALEAKTDEVSIAGRLVLFRGMGKNAFAHLQDETGRVQIFINK